MEVVQDDTDREDGGNNGPSNKNVPRPNGDLHTLKLRSREVEKPPNKILERNKGSLTYRPRSSNTSRKTEAEIELEDLLVSQEIEREKERLQQEYRFKELEKEKERLLLEKEREKERLELEKQLNELERKKKLQLMENKVRMSMAGSSKASIITGMSAASSRQRTLDWIQDIQGRDDINPSLHLGTEDLIDSSPPNVQLQEDNLKTKEHPSRRQAITNEPTVEERRAGHPTTNERTVKERAGHPTTNERTVKERAGHPTTNERSVEEKAGHPNVGNNLHPGAQVSSENYSNINHKQRYNDDLNFKTLFSRQLLSQELPTFDGNPLEWPHFISEFKRTSIICNFTDDENLIRMRHALKGKAKDCVEALLFLPGNLNSVLSRLENKFGRPDLIIVNLIEKLHSFIGSLIETNEHNLEQLADHLENLVNTIELVGKQEYIFNPILLHEITNKLNSNLKLKWGEYLSELGDNPIDLKTFSDWLRLKSNALLRVNFKVDIKSTQQYKPYDKDKKGYGS